MFSLSGSLESYEIRMKKSPSQSLEQAFQSKVNVSKEENQQRRHNGHKGENNKGRGHGRGFQSQQQHNSSAS